MAAAFGIADFPPLMTPEQIALAGAGLVRHVMDLYAEPEEAARHRSEREKERKS